MENVCSPRSATPRRVRFFVFCSQTQVNVTTPYAYLSLEVAQSVDSFEVIEEINPVEIAEILGNVGGFWGEDRVFVPSILL